MTSVSLDARWYRHPKFGKLGRDRAAALALHAAACCYCRENLTNGVIAPEALHGLLAYGDTAKKRKTDAAKWQRVADLMLVAGLLDRQEGVYEVHDYLMYNPSREDEMKRRARYSQMGKMGAEAKKAKTPTFSFDEDADSPLGAAAAMKDWPACMSKVVYSDTGVGGEMIERSLRGHILVTCQRELGDKWVMKSTNTGRMGAWIAEGCIDGCDGNERQACRCADLIRDAIETSQAKGRDEGKNGIGLIAFKLKEGARQ